jgi:hypothetical protein
MICLSDKQILRIARAYGLSDEKTLQRAAKVFYDEVAIMEKCEGVAIPSGFVPALLSTVKFHKELNETNARQIAQLKESLSLCQSMVNNAGIVEVMSNLRFERDKLKAQLQEAQAKLNKLEMIKDEELDPVSKSKHNENEEKWQRFINQYAPEEVFAAFLEAKEVKNSPDGTGWKATNVEITLTEEEVAKLTKRVPAKHDVRVGVKNDWNDWSSIPTVPEELRLPDEVLEDITEIHANYRSIYFHKPMNAPMGHYFFAVPKLIAEIRRLREGKLTQTEIQNLCHNLTLGLTK